MSHAQSIHRYEGNKIDKADEREVPKAVGQSFASSNAFEHFIETSALNATNVDQLFHEVAAKLTEELREENRCVTQAN